MTNNHFHEIKAAAGRLAAQTVFDKYGSYFPEGACALGGKISTHNKWHRDLGKFSSKCSICKNEEGLKHPE
jgi:hypothetical protein